MPILPNRVGANIALRRMMPDRKRDYAAQKRGWDAEEMRDWALQCSKFVPLQ
jgi:hypothetical protein